MQQLELLSPAKNSDIGIEAIKHGADAVYIGAARFGARAAAGNSLEDISRLVIYAHHYNARVYVTINTIIYDSEIVEVEKLIRQLYVIGVDALIVQDMSILRMNIPPIALHASTQCDIRTPQKAKFAEKVGFSQLVLARELTLSEIKDIKSSTSIPLESFIHGALCVSYSGRCQISEVCMQRSANRGACAQMCRLTYDLCDKNGNKIIEKKHLLSLKDYNSTNHITGLIEAGISSFKIEGRLKEVGYVKNVVAFYSSLLNQYISVHPDKFKRSSSGQVKLSFTPKLEKSFNRSFTQYFTVERKPTEKGGMASFDTPKSQGEYIGNLKNSAGKKIQINTAAILHNGDGISFISSTGEYSGCRVNRVENNNIFLSHECPIKPGTPIYRTFDKEFEEQINKESAARSIPVNMALRYSNGYLILGVTDEKGNYIQEVFHAGELGVAQKRQDQQQLKILSKLGGTIYEATTIETIGDYFIPSSMLTNLRRQAIEHLFEIQLTSYKYDYRKKEDFEIKYFTDSLTYADNVANVLSEKFYRSHGVTHIQKAIETSQEELSGDEVLMNTRYCIRRELGACKLTKNTSLLPNEIYLRHDNIKLAVECDCNNCEMKIRKI